MNETLSIIFQGYTLLFILQTVLWLIQQKTKDASTTDVGWAIGMSILVGWYFLHMEGFFLRKLLIFIPVIIWSLRLSSHLIRRNRHEGKEDGRYAQLRKEWGPTAGRNFFFIYQLQPIFNLILSVPFLIIFQNTTPQIHPLEVAALFIWPVGLLGETMADEQLRRFKKDPNKRGKICQEGLWHYSRHPNFFFEWLMWVAYFIYALASPYGLIALIAPVLMLHLLINVTGVPLMEKRLLQDNGEAFREYMRTTSFFIPLPKRIA